MSGLLMPKATAIWLIENTALTFDQISDFCDIHILEIQAIADGEVSSGILASIKPPVPITPACLPSSMVA